ncbi:hypothetical protein ACPFL9_17375 [Paenarthrobacter sp. NyZ202]|uniref:hypothetical protein n=1 Tax=Paenarthrobacter sp. NyZ202 TaxID=3402689 RepID=UPI003CE92915
MVKDDVRGTIMDVVRSELLRYMSGYSVLGVLAFAALVPWFIANFAGWPGNSEAVPPGYHIQAFWGLAASIAVVAAFAGSYVVSRESYYDTLRRTVLVSGLVAVAVAKYAAALAIGSGIMLTGIALWGASVAFAVPAAAHAELLSPESWRFLPGVVLAGAMASLWGCSLGWIIRHYYATTIVTMLLPLAVELPLLLSFPEAARWLPSGALAGVASLPLDGLLDPVPAFAVCSGWLAASGFAAAKVLEGTEF